MARRKIVEEVQEEVKTEVVSEETPKVEKKKAKEFKDTDGILCTSITPGKLGIIGMRTKIHYVWVSRGDQIEVEYQDLVAAVRAKRKCIFAPRFIIEDEDFLDKFPQVRETYGTLYDVRDLKKVITNLNPQSMKLTINTLPSGAKESIKALASSMIRSGELDSVSKIKVLDEIFGTNLMLLTELLG